MELIGMLLTPGETGKEDGVKILPQRHGVRQALSV
jgi:hypothetical protein